MPSSSPSGRASGCLWLHGYRGGPGDADVAFYRGAIHVGAQRIDRGAERAVVATRDQVDFATGQQRDEP